MKLVYDPLFVKQVKKVNVRVRRSTKHKLLIFAQDPDSPELNNHSLSREWEGHRSIDITSDYRAIFEEVEIDGETVAYFVALGSHKVLYKN